MTDNPIYCALDMTDTSEALSLAQKIAPHVGGLKIGMEFFYSQGRAGYQQLADLGLPIFLDLKLHDIPNTVGQSLKALAKLQPQIINVHAFGGLAMMQQARSVMQEYAPTSWLIGVTVLTSLSDQDVSEMGVCDTASQQALKLAQLAHRAQLDGVVCSAHEIDHMRAQFGTEFKLIVPGLRPTTAQADDQKRVMTPEAAYEKGADVLVIGRAITAAADPAAAAATIFETLAAAPIQTSTNTRGQY